MLLVTAPQLFGTLVSVAIVAAAAYARRPRQPATRAAGGDRAAPGRRRDRADRARVRSERPVGAASQPGHDAGSSATSGRSASSRSRSRSGRGSTARTCRGRTTSRSSPQRCSGCRSSPGSGSRSGSTDGTTSSTAPPSAGRRSCSSSAPRSRSRRFPVLARIIEEHGLVGTPVGSLAVSCAAVNDVLSWIALAIALLADSGSGSLEVAKLVGGAVGLVAVLVVLARVRRPARLVTAAPTSPCVGPRRGRPCRRGRRDVGAGPALRLRRIRVRRRSSRGPRSPRSPQAPFAWPPLVGALLLPLYLVLPGATTNFRDLDLRAGRRGARRARWSPPARSWSPAPSRRAGPASRATTRSRSASC